MRLEGIAEIELIDVNTREKETIVEKNMVTNALNYIFSMRNMLSASNISSALLPLFKNGLGGVLVFDENIEEKPENVLPLGNINCIGHAGNNAYSGLNERRGSFNESESGLIDKGMKLVWDFTTNQANGSIKCISLTSSNGGAAGYGSQNGKEVMDFFCLGSSYSSGYIPIDRKEIVGKDFSVIIEWAAGGTKINIKKYNRVFGNYITLTKSFKTKELIEDVTIELVASIKAVSCGTFRVEKDFYYSFCLDSDKKVILIKIKKEDFSVEYADLSFTVPEDTNFIPDCSFIINNYAFIYVYNNTPEGKKFIKVNLSKVSEKENIPNPGNYSPAGHTRSTVANRMPLYSGSIIDENGKILKGINASAQPLTALFENDLSVIQCYDYNGEYRAYPGAISGYLATINNLATPVIKTSDKTMKITYTITEKAE